jgi:FKBP-type peptidyl-prolyl cis-trans isomerase
MRICSPVIALGALLCLSLIVGAGKMDYSKVPPAPAHFQTALSSAKVDLAGAIGLAEQQTKARATAAECSLDGSRVEVLVTLMGGSTMYHARVDASAGTVMDVQEKPMNETGLPGDVVKGEPVKTASGLMYYDIRAGEGKSPASAASRVTVHYTGWLVDGTKFDSSLDRGQPITFPLNGVIPGWTEGVGSMKVGGKRKLVIPYQLAYGEQGRPPTIPQKAMLIFDVELISIAN